MTLTPAQTSRVAQMSTPARNALADQCAAILANPNADGVASGIAAGLLNAINAHIDAETAGVLSMSDAELSMGDAY